MKATLYFTLALAILMIIAFYILNSHSIQASIKPLILIPLFFGYTLALVKYLIAFIKRNQ